MSHQIIREWSLSDRPREKLLEQGRRALTDAELLAILIGSGTSKETAVDLCRRILASVEYDLFRLSRLEVSELMEFKGIGAAKAITIVAALELGRRRQETDAAERALLNSSSKAYQFLRYKLQDLGHEEFWVVYLNTGCKVLQTQFIGKGGADFTPVDVRMILKAALLCNATSLILFHNHPAGTLKPSEADKKITKKIKSAAEFMELKVHDHIIISDTGYFSFRDEDLL